MLAALLTADKQCEGIVCELLAAFPVFALTGSSSCSSVPELRPGAAVRAHHLHRLLRLRLGHFPLLLPAEWRRHGGRSPGVDVSQEGRGGRSGSGDVGLRRGEAE